MEAAPRRFLLGVCVVAMLMAIAVANAGSGEAASVIGLAKCADCTRKNVNAEAAFSGLKVAIKCKNSNGEYESKAVGELQSSGAFSVPVSVNLADCVAQLHSAAGTPCPGQEPSRITPLSDGTFVAVPGKTQQASSAVCASVTICGPIKNYFHEHFHKKEEKPEPSKPEPEPKPQPEHQPPTPTYGSPSPTTPIYHPPAMHMRLTDHFHKDHELEHFFDHFHRKPVVPPKHEPQPKPQPENQPPTPTYGSATPKNGSPAPVSNHAPHMFDHFYKGHHHHHFFDYFHKKRVPPEPKPEPKPQPENHPPVQTFGSPPPLYHPPAKH
ncbi:unnamed protein product [Miscanthus lutarioriparius]|uniref:Proline-rich protein n=1 Tax=Miscanthus lutarioriparius TaxID=422564 RepID=A0A811MCD9_9POAL|nr:unnamed protein product [Miscanthus lutarioriparius]